MSEEFHQQDIQSSGMGQSQPLVTPPAEDAKSTLACTPGQDSGRVFDFTNDSISPAPPEAPPPQNKILGPDGSGFGVAAAKWQPVRQTPVDTSRYDHGDSGYSPFSQPSTQTSQTLQQAVTGVLPTSPLQENRPVHEDHSETLLKRLRTYEGDIAEAMAHRNASLTAIALAEKKRAGKGESIGTAEPQEHTSRLGHNIFMVLLSIILLGGGALGAYYLYSISPLAPVAQPVRQPVRTGIIPSDSHVTINTHLLSPASIKIRVEDEFDRVQSPGTIRELVFTGINSSNSAVRVGARDMIEIMDIVAPDILTRSLTTDWMFGLYAPPEGGTKGTFVIVTTNFFQNAFTGMLQWETVMADELKIYISPRDTPSPATTTATTTSTATSTPAPYPTIRGRFEDKIVMNKDVRVFRTDQGTTLFLYSFVDDSHLIIADSEITLAEVLRRLEKQSFVR